MANSVVDPNKDRDEILGPKRLIKKTDKARDVEQAFSGLNKKFEEQHAQRQARKQQLSYFNLTGFPISQKALRLITKEEAEEARAIPFYLEGRLVKIGVVDPKNDELQKLQKKLEQKNYDIEIYLVSDSALQSALQQYSKLVESAGSLDEEIELSASQEQTEKLKQMADLGEQISSVSISEMINTMISAAISMRASDIHLEPEEDKFNIRFRIDGVLQQMASMPKTALSRLLSRLKLLSKLKINVTNTPQEGHFTADHSGKEIDLRVSILPTSFGESVTMRILGSEDLFLHVEDLGMRAETLKVVMQELKKRNGMILTTGPTGSGKTTTLYSFLSHLNKPGVKIITLEDPVEYSLEGITHTPIDTKAGVTFSDSLKVILRQDPDIVMIGEVRDAETAKTSAEAALTGHVVLSTLHTNDSSGAIPRLLDLGVGPNSLAPALNLLIAQRLVRRICKHCRERYEPKPAELERVKRIIGSISEKAEVEIPERLVFYHSTGCEQCHDLGYKGRIGVFESFAVDEDMEKMIFQQASSREIQKLAVERGMVTIQQDAVLKALSGVTDLAEVWRVTEE